MASKTRAGAPVRQTPVRTEPARDTPRDGEQKKVRRRKNIASQSPTHIPEHMIPEGVDLQWVTDSIHGQPDPQGRIAFEINAWEPVTPDMFEGRFDGMFMAKGHKGEINVHGAVLMWRPIELTIEARQEERQEALQAKRAVVRKLRQGEIDGIAANGYDPNHPTAEKIRHVGYEQTRVQLIPE